MTDSVLWSTPSTDLGEADAGNDTVISAWLDDGQLAGMWRCVWPVLCLAGLVGNSLVLLVLRREGLARTSANVYLTVLAVADSCVLVVASVAFYPRVAWGARLDETNVWTCRVVWSAHHTLSNAAIWTVVAFTAERYVAVRFPLRKLRVCTPRSAGACCASLLALAFVKNADVFVVLAPFVDHVTNGTVTCALDPRHVGYVVGCRPWINFVAVSVVPLSVVVFCNGAIIGELRRTAADRKLILSAVVGCLPRTTAMCMSVSLAFVVCVVSGNVVIVIRQYWPVRAEVMHVVFLLRYANHAANFFLYCLTGTHFRRELAVLVCDGTGCAATVGWWFRSRAARSSGDDIEMRQCERNM